MRKQPLARTVPLFHGEFTYRPPGRWARGRDSMSMDIGALGLQETLLLALDEERVTSSGGTSLPGDVVAAVSAELSPVGRRARCSGRNATHQMSQDSVADELRSRAGAALRRVEHRRYPTFSERLRDLLAAFGLYQRMEPDSSEKHLSLRSDT